MSSISVIIPTFNEEVGIANIIKHLLTCDGPIPEILVIDGGSTDNTLKRASNAGAKTFSSPGKGRAIQMNYGASKSNGEILYFVHADCLPPTSFPRDIDQAVKNGFGLGRYRTKFLSSKLLLKINAFFTRFDWFICYGGDQTLFMKKSLFQSIGGYREEMRIMEDYDIIVRARKLELYKIMEGNALVSARKYDYNSWYKVLKANSTIIRMYKNNATQSEMVDTYKRLLHFR